MSNFMGLDIPEAWDKNYKEKLHKNIIEYLQTYYYDSTNKDVIMKNMMNITKGTINPKQVESAVDEFLNTPLPWES